MIPRIVDIAKEAEVSPSAVSLALNHKSGVSDEVRQKIISIAARLGYKNRFPEFNRNNGPVTVKLLKIAKHGHIVNDRHNAFITEYMEGIETAAKKKRYKLEVSFFNKVPVQEIVAVQRGIAAGGLIVLGTELNAHELSFFTELSQPVVFIDTAFPLLAYDCVDMDNRDGVFKAVQHLYHRGHRSIGLVKSAYETWNFKIREAGFRDAMEYFSLPVQEHFIIPVDPTFEQSVADMNKRLDQLKKLPSAFFCMNDIIAYGCMKALRDHSLKIPGDISIIGFDDLPSSNLAEPPLTTVRVSSHQIGQRALEKISERIEGLSDPRPEKILVAGTLIARESVKKIYKDN
ncbi:MAG: LacI family DNA-binding transcriptional regulator [Spirochaetaceae bacterium]|jgi:LacI family transcriptional regulator|nr:LacI family DNA-binding transcriptional regulator [Spirochaetaceae bacterium]